MFSKSGCVSLFGFKFGVWGSGFILLLGTRLALTVDLYSQTRDSDKPRFFCAVVSTFLGEGSGIP